MKREFFNLFGISFYVSGDTERARELVGQARKMHFQRDLVGVPKLNIKYPDGSFIQILREAEQNFAWIHVPTVYDKKEKKHERIEVQYLPAFEALDSDYNHVGYIICFGGGFNGPYEFIPKIDGYDISDPWEYGEYLEEGSEVPFDDLDEYLTFKFVYNDSIESLEKTERTFFDVPPIGVQNHIFRVADGAAVTTGGDVTINENGNFLCCFNGSTFISGDAVGVKGKFWTASMSSVTTSTYSFCIGEESKTFGYSPDGPFGTTMLTDAGSTVVNHNAFGDSRTHYLAGWTEVGYPGVEVTCELVTSYLNGQTVEPPVIENYTDFQTECHDSLYTQNTTENGIYNYGSNAIDAEQHCFVYGSRSYSSYYEIEKEYIPGDIHSCQEEWPWFLDPLDGSITTKSEDTDDTRQNYISCSNHIVSLDHVTRMYDIDPRYYQVGDTEYFLAHICHDYSDGKYKHTYFCAINDGNGLHVYDSLVMFGGALFIDFPNITDFNGNALQIRENFRLVQLIKTIKEE